MTSIDLIEQRVIACTRCPELVTYREAVAREKVRRHRDQEYWGKPVPGFGDHAARLVLIGLAPGAHGSNRTGRMFTGDASGDWLYRALYHNGFANTPAAIDRADGLELRDCFITAAVRCAPPQNKPSTQEKARCLPYLVDELAALARLRVVVTLGKIADDAFHSILKRQGAYAEARRPFGHGVETLASLGRAGNVTVISSYHPSRQNTNTGVLTEPMLDHIFKRARALLT